MAFVDFGINISIFVSFVIFADCNEMCLASITYFRKLIDRKNY